jgi:hypothetical protein
MKNKHKHELSFGELVTAAYQVWGAGVAAKMLRLAIKARVVVFNGHLLGASDKRRAA